MKKFCYLLITLILISTLFGCTESFTITTDIQPANSGTVTVSPSSAKYQKDSIVNLTASPATNMVFDHWSGDANDSAPSIYITLDSNKKVTANFKQLFNLNVIINPPGSGSVSAESRLYKEGESVIITATPTLGFRFTNWSGDNTSSNVTINIIMDSEKTLQANFLDVPPADVRNVTAKSGKNTVTLSWVEPNDTDLDRVEVACSTLSSPVVIKRGISTAVVSGLNSPSSYEFIVTAIDVAGNRSTGVKVSATPYIYASTDFLKFTDGYGIKYRVKDNYQGQVLDCDVWAISHYIKTRLDKKYDFLFTLTKDGTSGGYFRESLMAGYTSTQSQGVTATSFNLGNPVGNQANFYFWINLPVLFNADSSWSWIYIQFKAESCEPQILNGTTFQDCIKVSFDASNRSNPYERGSGYFVFARDVGLIKLVFNRTDGSTCSYEYLSTKQFDEAACSVIFDSVKPY